MPFCKTYHQHNLARKALRWLIQRLQGQDEPTRESARLARRRRQLPQRGQRGQQCSARCRAPLPPHIVAEVDHRRARPACGTAIFHVPWMNACRNQGPYDKHRNIPVGVPDDFAKPGRQRGQHGHAGAGAGAGEQSGSHRGGLGSIFQEKGVAAGRQNFQQVRCRALVCNLACLLMRPVMAPLAVSCGPSQLYASSKHSKMRTSTGSG